MNRSAIDTAQLLADSERFLTYMAIPFVLSVYQTFAADTVRLLRRDEIDASTRDPALIPLEEIHDYLVAEASFSLPATEIALFDFIRQVRNRIVHYGGLPGSNLKAAYTSLPGSAKTLWADLTGAHFQIEGPRVPMSLRAQELIPALAVTKRLGKALNGELTRRISRGLWARLIAEDYEEMEPERYRDKAKRVRKVHGLASHYYTDLHLTKSEIEEALNLRSSEER
jgi:hypothetical protein